MKAVVTFALLACGAYIPLLAGCGPGSELSNSKPTDVTSKEGVQLRVLDQAGSPVRNAQVFDHRQTVRAATDDGGLCTIALPENVDYPATLHVTRYGHRPASVDVAGGSSVGLLDVELVRLPVLTKLRVITSGSIDPCDKCMVTVANHGDREMFGGRGGGFLVPIFESEHDFIVSIGCEEHACWPPVAGTQFRSPPWLEQVRFHLYEKRSIRISSSVFKVDARRVVFLPRPAKDSPSEVVALAMSMQRYGIPCRGRSGGGELLFEQVPPIDYRVVVGLGRAGMAQRMITGSGLHEWDIEDEGPRTRRDVALLDAREAITGAIVMPGDWSLWDLIAAVAQVGQIADPSQILRPDEWQRAQSAALAFGGSFLDSSGRGEVTLRSDDRHLTILCVDGSYILAEVPVGLGAAEGLKACHYGSLEGTLNRGGLRVLVCGESAAVGVVVASNALELPLMADGSFRVPRLRIGDYRIFVVDQSGDVVFVRRIRVESGVDLKIDLP